MLDVSTYMRRLCCCVDFPLVRAHKKCLKRIRKCQTVVFCELNQRLQAGGGMNRMRRHYGLAGEDTCQVES